MSRTDKVECKCDRCGKTQVYDKSTLGENSLESLGWMEEAAVGSGGKWLLCQSCDAVFRQVVTDCMTVA